MKKAYFLLPVTALMLAGCTTSSTSETQSAEITPAGTAWQTDVQTAEMPSTMSQPSYQPQVVTQPVLQPSYGQPSYGQPSYGATTTSNTAEQVGACRVERDAQNKPVYANIQKGCYTDSAYTVGKYDTLYLIAYLTGQQPAQIAAFNNLSTATPLKVGQVLRVR